MLALIMQELSEILRPSDVKRETHSPMVKNTKMFIELSRLIETNILIICVPRQTLYAGMIIIQCLKKYASMVLNIPVFLYITLIISIYSNNA